MNTERVFYFYFKSLKYEINIINTKKGIMQLYIA